jgi:hypothetical protein
MGYLRHLIHRATIKRPTATLSDTRAEVVTLSTVATGVKCHLHPRSNTENLMKYGADVSCDAVLLFPVGTDIRPSHAATKGTADYIEVTDQRGEVTKWRVESTREVAMAGKVFRVFVTKAET